MNSKKKYVTEEIANCPIYKTIELFQGKWHIWILFELSRNEAMRFGEIQKAIPSVSNTMLAATLKDLEAKGLVKRTQFNEIPPHVEYSATESAKELRHVFKAMCEWGEKFA